MTGVFGSAVAATQPPFHPNFTSNGAQGWGHALWASTTGHGDAREPTRCAFPGAVPAGAAAGGGGGAHSAWRECGGDSGGVGGGGWVAGAAHQQPQPQPPLQAAGVACGGGGGSRGRPGRKPHARPEDLQSRLDALGAQFGRLSAENQFLKSKLKALETVLPWRETSVNFLASVKTSSSSSNGAVQQCPAGLQQQQQQQQTQKHAVAPDLPRPPPSCNGGDRAAAQLTAPLLHAAAQVPGLCGSSTSRLGDAAAGTPAPAAAAAATAATLCPHASAAAPACPPLIVALCPGPDDDEAPDISPAGVEALKRVGVPEFLMLWKHIALQASLLVAGAEAAGPGSAKAARLERYTARLYSYLDKVVRLSPDCWMDSMSVNAETGLRERPSDDYWLAVGRYANLSRQQLQEVAHLAQALDAAVGPVVQERAALAAQLAAHIRHSAMQPTALDATAALTAVDELAEALVRNVALEQRRHDDATDFLWLSTLSAVQGARVVAAAYPFVPDALAIMHACRRLLGSS
ncbi:hypothetical protein HXX76_013678 [Chlamydomonas incerta]|uniref:Uncharacterized protein n=1 Tax=Chlamydomonas incerta TaxID=51695 RepID=A0A835SDV3_CHLIN|nr:hypothetical protein HXX76_013678 [Chlamydomonas incerta]|eukprot:KAG2425468.1 hypothetical protein HXX76_013678 [Chlamydomonas incerta]